VLKPHFLLDSKFVPVSVCSILEIVRIVKISNSFFVLQSISLVQSGYSGPELFDKLTTSSGYLNKQGYCIGSQCKTFPIIVGETGSDLQDPRDLQFYESLRRYIKLEGDADDGRHTAIQNVFWWCFNANSGDTKGIVLDDWTTINW
jgi:hypothetical protein